MARSNVLEALIEANYTRDRTHHAQHVEVLFAEISPDIASACDVRHQELKELVEYRAEKWGE